LEEYWDCDEKCWEAREEYCQRCCTEYLAQEPCPECDCTDIIDEFLEDEEWWNEEEEL